MSRNQFTTLEINNTATALKEKGASETEINTVITAMRKYEKTEKNSSKGIKIALRRKGNQLGISFEMNIENQAVRLSNFTGTPQDKETLTEVARKLGYTVEGGA